MSLQMAIITVGANNHSPYRSFYGIVFSLLIKDNQMIQIGTIFLNIR
jgi:hypothetical protein